MKIYLDYAATTPVDPDVFRAMKPYFAEQWGNAGSLHYFGQKAMKALDESREKIAGSIGADFREIIFTGSATEANNLALRGVIGAARKNFAAPYRIVISKIEHESVLKTAQDLEREGVEVVYLPVDKSGLVNLKKLKESLNERTILISIMYANNELGTIQPIKEIAKIIKDYRGSNSYPLFHSDAVQAFQFLSCDVNELGVDLMTLSAHKIYGPKGIGALYVRDKNNLSPIIFGGGQEYGLRSGTENIPSIVGFAKAVGLAIKNREKEGKKISALRDYFWNGLKKANSKIKLNGSAKNRLPNILNVNFPACAGRSGKSAEDLLIKLDLAGVAISAGSACSARSLEPSYVLRACGLPLNVIKSSLRISLGRFTTREEVSEALKIIKKAY
jgi:cysteine desulfurase